MCAVEAYTEHSLVHFKKHVMRESLTNEGVSPIEIRCRMQVVHGDDCVDVSTLCHWTKQCKDGKLGRADLCDKQRNG